MKTGKFKSFDFSCKTRAWTPEPTVMVSQEDVEDVGLTVAFSDAFYEYNNECNTKFYSPTSPSYD